MGRYLTIAIVIATSLYAATLYAATGETWEVTTKNAATAGGSFPIPETVMTVCIPPGGTKDPKQLLQQDDSCERTDVKTSGKMTTWKVRCGIGEDEMTGAGDVTLASDSFQGTTTMSGRAVTTKVTYQGKRIGTACDTNAPPVVKGMEGLNELMGLAKSEMSAARAEQCEVANNQPIDLISSRFFGPTAACTGKEKFACKVIAKAIAKDPAAYAKLAKYEETSDLGIAKACNIDMAAAAKAICGKVNGSNYEEIAEYCPEQARKFTAEDSKPSGQETTGPSVSTIIDNAQKLKGLFGF